MKFLTRKDLQLVIDDYNLCQLLSPYQDVSNEYISDYKLLDLAEESALTTVGEFLRGKYDLDYELREILEYQVNTIYPDDQRLSLNGTNSVNNTFGGIWNIDLIDSDITYPTIVKLFHNTCEEEFDKGYPNNSELNYRGHYGGNPMIRTAPVPYGEYNTNNPDYDKTCGRIPFGTGDEYYTTNNIKNLYTVDYTTTGLVDIDFTAITSSAQMSTIIGNIDHFKQYDNTEISTDDRNRTLINIVRDLTIYELSARVAAQDIPQIYLIRRDDAQQALKDIRFGKRDIDLREHDWSNAQQTGSNFRWGRSYASYKNDY